MRAGIGISHVRRVVRLVPRATALEASALGGMIVRRWGWGERSLSVAAASSCTRRRGEHCRGSPGPSRRSPRPPLQRLPGLAAVGVLCYDPGTVCAVAPRVP